MTHENPFSWLCKLFMVHENNGFFNTFSWDFHEKEIRSVLGLTADGCMELKPVFDLINRSH